MPTRTHLCRPLLVGLLALSWLGVASTHAADEPWSRFRGPNGEGISAAKCVPTEVNAGNTKWKTDLPGEGHSSPIFFGDKLFITATTKASATLHLLCYDPASGKKLWQRDYKSEAHRQHRYNSYASSTPAADKRHVYFVWATPAQLTLVALTHDGEEAWRKDLGAFKSQHGSGMAPLVHDGMVVLPNFQIGRSFIVALDAQTGKEVWRTPRDGNAKTAYGAGCVYTPKGGKPQLIFNSHAHGICALDPKSGAVVWEKAGIFRLRSVSSSLVAEGIAIGSCGSGGGGNYVVGVRPGTDGKPAEVAWTMKRSAPYVPTSLAYDGKLFLFSDSGFAVCLDPKTGEDHWRQRVNQDGFFGSPVCIDGKLYVISKSGRLHVIKASGEFQSIATSDLGELSYSTPAVHGGKLYLRTKTKLMCVAGK